MANHKATQPKKQAGTAGHLVFIDCPPCKWRGRLTTPEKAKAEFEIHASGEIMEWEIEGAHQDAIWEDRVRSQK